MLTYQPVFQPIPNLRWFVRAYSETPPVLQQLWVNPVSGESEWRELPTHVEVPDEPPR